MPGLRKSHSTKESQSPHPKLDAAFLAIREHFEKTKLPGSEEHRQSLFQFKQKLFSFLDDPDSARPKEVVDWIETSLSNILIGVPAKLSFGFVYNAQTTVFDLLNSVSIKFPSTSQDQADVSLSLETAGAPGAMLRCMVVLAAFSECLKSMDISKTSPLNRPEWIDLICSLVKACKGGRIGGSEVAGTMTDVLYLLVNEGDSVQVAKALRNDETLGFTRLGKLLQESNCSLMTINLLRVLVTLLPPIQDKKGRLVHLQMVFEDMGWDKDVTKKLMNKLQDNGSKEREFEPLLYMDLINIMYAQTDGRRRPRGFPLRAWRVDGIDKIETDKAQRRLLDNQLICYIDKNLFLIKNFDEVGGEEDATFPLERMTNLGRKVGGRDSYKTFQFSLHKSTQQGQQFPLVELGVAEYIADDVEKAIEAQCPKKPLQLSSQLGKPIAIDASMTSGTPMTLPWQTTVASSGPSEVPDSVDQGQSSALQQATEESLHDDLAVVSDVVGIPSLEQTHPTPRRTKAAKPATQSKAGTGKAKTPKPSQASQRASAKTKAPKSTPAINMANGEAVSDDVVDSFDATEQPVPVPPATTTKSNARRNYTAQSKSRKSQPAPAKARDEEEAEVHASEKIDDQPESDLTDAAPRASASMRRNGRSKKADTESKLSTQDPVASQSRPTRAAAAKSSQKPTALTITHSGASSRSEGLSSIGTSNDNEGSPEGIDKEDNTQEKHGTRKPSSKVSVVQPARNEIVEDKAQGRKGHQPAKAKPTPTKTQRGGRKLTKKVEVAEPIAEDASGVNDATNQHQDGNGIEDVATSVLVDESVQPSQRLPEPVSSHKTTKTYGRRSTSVMMSPMKTRPQEESLQESAGIEDVPTPKAPVRPSKVVLQPSKATTNDTASRKASEKVNEEVHDELNEKGANNANNKVTGEAANDKSNVKVNEGTIVKILDHANETVKNNSTPKTSDVAGDKTTHKASNKASPKSAIGKPSVVIPKSTKPAQTLHAAIQAGLKPTHKIQTASDGGSAEVPIASLPEMIAKKSSAPTKVNKPTVEPTVEPTFDPAVEHVLDNPVEPSQPAAETDDAPRASKQSEPQLTSSDLLEADQSLSAIDIGFDTLSAPMDEPTPAKVTTRKQRSAPSRNKSAEDKSAKSRPAPKRGRDEETNGDAIPQSEASNVEPEAPLPWEKPVPKSTSRGTGRTAKIPSKSTRLPAKDVGDSIQVSSPMKPPVRRGRGSSEAVIQPDVIPPSKRPKTEPPVKAAVESPQKKQLPKAKIDSEVDVFPPSEVEVGSENEEDPAAAPSDEPNMDFDDVSIVNELEPPSLEPDARDEEMELPDFKFQPPSSSQDSNDDSRDAQSEDDAIMNGWVKEVQTKLKIESKVKAADNTPKTASNDTPKARGAGNTPRVKPSQNRPAATQDKTGEKSSRRGALRAEDEFKSNSIDDLDRAPSISKYLGRDKGFKTTFAAPVTVKPAEVEPGNRRVSIRGGAAIIGVEVISAGINAELPPRTKRKSMDEALELPAAVAPQKRRASGPIDMERAAKVPRTRFGRKEAAPPANAKEHCLQLLDAYTGVAQQMTAKGMDRPARMSVRAQRTLLSAMKHQVESLLGDTDATIKPCFKLHDEASKESETIIKVGRQVLAECKKRTDAVDGVMAQVRKKANARKKMPELLFV